MMAKIKGPLEIKWRGTRGGITGQMDRMGSVRRSHFTVHIHQWPTRQPYNSTMNAMLHSWRNLSSAERSDWDTFGLNFPQPDRYGGMISLSGFNWFIKLNSVARLWALNPILTPPPDPFCDYNPTLLFTDPGPGTDIILSAAVGAPAFARVIVRRKLNFPISSTWFPNPLNWFQTLSFSLLPAFVVASNSEIQEEPRNHFFEAIPFDDYGRQGTKTMAIFSRYT